LLLRRDYCLACERRRTKRRGTRLSRRIRRRIGSRMRVGRLMGRFGRRVGFRRGLMLRWRGLRAIMVRRWRRMLRSEYMPPCGCAEGSICDGNMLTLFLGPWSTRGTLTVIGTRSLLSGMSLRLWRRRRISSYGVYGRSNIDHSVSMRQMRLLGVIETHTVDVECKIRNRKPTCKIIWPPPWSPRDPWRSDCPASHQGCSARP
jgi:hypothetical protein